MNRLFFAVMIFIVMMTSTPTLGNSAADTAAKPLRGRHYGFGLGLSLGTVPLFNRWIDGLPDSLSHIGINDPFFGRRPPGDTMQLRYRVIEPPEEFNYFMPLSFTVYDIRERGAASIGASFFYNTKQFQSTLFPHLDSAERRVNLHQTMRYFSFTLEAAYHFEIPPRYFSVNNSRHTYLTLMLGASPAQYFTREGGLTLHAPDDDPRMRETADAITASLKDVDGNGAAISWRVGLTTVREGSGGGGLMIGIHYGGAYSGWFWRDGTRVMNSHIHTAENEPDRPLAFMSNRIEFSLTLLRSFKRNLTSLDNVFISGVAKRE